MTTNIAVEHRFTQRDWVHESGSTAHGEQGRDLTIENTSPAVRARRCFEASIGTSPELNSRAHLGVVGQSAQWRDVLRKATASCQPSRWVAAPVSGGLTVSTAKTNVLTERSKVYGAPEAYLVHLHRNHA